MTAESESRRRGQHNAPSVARRISGWTSNLLATGIVLVAALGLGRQLVVWWGVDSDAQVGAPPAAIPLGSPPEELQFGDSGHFVERQSLRGARDAALEAMRAACRRIARSQQWPSESPGENESAFLQRMAERGPAESGVGWQLHQFDGQFPIVVGIGIRLQSEASTTSAEGAPVAKQPEALRRVLAWSLATPSGEGQWTIYTWRAGGSRSPTSPLAEIPLPPQSRRTLTLRSKEESVIGLAGSAPLEAWKRHFDNLARERGWPAEPWRLGGTSWHTRYFDPQASQAIDVQLSEPTQGRLVGMVIVQRGDGAHQP
jgi:hypothetical protein